MSDILLLIAICKSSEVIKKIVQQNILGYFNNLRDFLKYNKREFIERAQWILFATNLNIMNFYVRLLLSAFLFDYLLQIY